MLGLQSYHTMFYLYPILWNEITFFLNFFPRRLVPQVWLANKYQFSSQVRHLQALHLLQPGPSRQTTSLCDCSVIWCLESCGAAPGETGETLRLHLPVERCECAQTKGSFGERVAVGQKSGCPQWSDEEILSHATLAWSLVADMCKQYGLRQGTWFFCASNLLTTIIVSHLFFLELVSQWSDFNDRLQKSPHECLRFHKCWF